MSSLNPFLPDDEIILPRVNPSLDYVHLAEPTERLRNASLDMLSTKMLNRSPEQKSLVVGVAAAHASKAPPPHPPGFQRHLAHVFHHAKGIFSNGINRTNLLGIVGHTGGAIQAISGTTTSDDDSSSSDGEADEEAEVAYPSDDDDGTSYYRAAAAKRTKREEEAAWVKPAKAIAQVAAQAAVQTAAHHLREWAARPRK